jgi:hypothetical protein
MRDHEADLDRDVRHAVYRHFVDTGGAPAKQELAAALGVPGAAVEASLRRLEAAHMLVLAPGTAEIWMAHPFSAVPTLYPVHAGGRRCWANCAWDALAIPALLGVDADTKTRCPDCGERLALRTRGGEMEPTDAVVHFAVPPRRFWENIGFT